MKLNEVIAKYGNQEVDESKIKEVLGVKESKVWKPKSKELYWYISPSGNLNNSIFSDYRTDIKQFEIGNIYKTKEEAEFARDKKLFEVKMERYLSEHEDEPVDWENINQTKYGLILYRDKIAIRANNGYRYIKQGTIYTTSKEALEQFIADNEADIKKYLFGVE